MKRHLRSTISTERSICRVIKMARVSIIIPTFNSQETIERALQSVHAQSFTDYEVIVADDGSADGTLDVLRSCQKNLPIKIVEHGQRKGPAAARNSALQLASGEYVAFLDSDDEWCSSKLSLQVAAMDANPEASLCTCDARWVAPDGHDLGTVLPAPTPPSGPDGWKYVLWHRHVATPCVVARRSTVEECGGFDEQMFVGQDVDLWVRLAFRGDVITLPDELVRYHVTAASHIRRHHMLAYSLLLPKLLQYVEMKKDDLTPEEYNKIKGSILLRFGRDAYRSGMYRSGFTFLLRGAWLDGSMATTLLFLLNEFPMTKSIKGQLRRTQEFFGHRQQPYVQDR